MSIWNHTLRLDDVFHDEARSFEQRRNEICRRIRASRFWDEYDMELNMAVEELLDAEDADAFDGGWDRFYDWADRERVWVVTR